MSKQEKIRVIIKDPGEEVGHEETIANELEDLQKAVGGYIETVTILDWTDDKQILIICDEEGRLEGKPHDCVVHGIDVVGTSIVAASQGEKLISLPERAMDLWKAILTVSKFVDPSR